MNNKVTVTGMEVTTKVGSNLMIKEDTLASQTKIADAQFTTAVNTVLASTILEPVSTTTGKAFFYTTNALSTGDAAADDYKAFNAAEVPTSEELTTFNTAYGTTGAVAYKDYVFQLKAVNADTSAAKDIKITQLSLTYGAAVDAGKAFRVAVFVEDITSAAPAGGSATLKGIYAPSGAANQSGDKAISAASTAPTALSAAYNTVSSIASVAPGATEYYKVVVRLYLEGEDTTCKNDTYAKLTESWKLDLTLKIDTESETNVAATCIKQITSATVSETPYWYDGTNVYTTQDNAINGTSGTAKDSADEAVKTAFGIS